MKYYYSKSTNGFYCKEVHNSMPNDVVLVTNEHWENIKLGYSNGKIIVSDENGYPTTIVAPEIPINEIALNLFNQANLSGYNWNKLIKSQQNILIKYLDELQEVINGNQFELPIKPDFLT